MLKRDEVASPTSCWNKAHDDEYVFVLRGSDEAAPATIRAWVTERARLGKNAATDPQITGALDDAKRIETERPGVARSTPRFTAST